MLPTPLPFRSFKKLLNQFNALLIRGSGRAGRGSCFVIYERVYQAITTLHILGIYTKQPRSQTN